MSLEKEIKGIDNTRKCQRNWDLSKDVPQEHIDHWIYLATNSPSKQDESFFDLYVLTDREKINFLCKDHSWGFTMESGKDKVVRNPQIGANVLFCFNKKSDDSDVRNFDEYGNPRDPNSDSFEWSNPFTSIGIASGIVAFSANMMGYRTGYAKCMTYKQTPKESKEVWGETLGIPKAENQLAFCLGIGYPDETLEWNQSKDNNEYLSGGPINWKQNKLEKDFKYYSFSSNPRTIKVIKI